MEVIKANDDNFEELLAKHDKVVVKYYAGWCGSCRLIAPKFKNLSNQEDLAEVVFLDVDAENSPKARAFAKVNNLPFFASFKNGELVEGFPSSKIEAVEELAKNL